MKLIPPSRVQLSSLVVVALLAGSAGAQEREPATSRASPAAAAGFERPDASFFAQSIARRGPDRVHYDEPGDGNVWVRGADYKASFGPQGAVFYPRLGPRAPRNVPHALSPDVVTIAGAPIQFTRAATAVRTGARVELDRGAFVEAYDVELGGMEQTFVFATLPTRGEIVVHIPVASEFEGRATDDGLEFRGELGSVRYTRAVAVDALGRRADMRTEIVDGAIEIVVGAEFVDSAVLPLVIDPFIYLIAVDDGPQENFAADVAWNPNHDDYMAVFEEVYSATDHDVRAVFFSFPSTPVYDAYFDFTTADCVGPRTANLYAYEQCLVVMTMNGPVPRAFGRVVDMVSHVMGPWITIAENARAPVVGGDPYPTPGSASYYCVAYERTTAGVPGIRARLVRPDSTLLGSEIQIANVAGQDHRAPAISKSNGGTEWMIAWERHDTVNLHSEIWGARVRWNGDLSAAAFLVAPSVPYEPRVSVSSPLAGRDEYLVAWQQPTGPSTREIRLAYLDGSTVASTMNLTEAEGFGAARAPSDPSVDSDGQHFMVAYADDLTPFTQYPVVVSELGISAGALTLIFCNRILYSFTSANLVRITGLPAAGETDPNLQQQYLGVWDVRAPGGVGDIYGALFIGSEGGPKRPYCMGDGSGTACPCGNASASWPPAGCLNSLGLAGQLDGMGSAQTTNDTLNLFVTDIPPNASAPTLFQGTSTPNGLPGGVVFGDGLRCVTGSVIRLGPVVPIGAGDWALGASYAGTPLVSVAGAIPPAGATRYYQALYRNAAAFCTPATFNTTNGYRIVWMP